MVYVTLKIQKYSSHLFNNTLQIVNYKDSQLGQNLNSSK
jgi:hypothetical protein